jgi:hypothetical protein
MQVVTSEISSVAGGLGERIDIIEKLAKEKIQALENKVSQCARLEDHSALAEQLDHMDIEVGEAAKYTKDVQVLLDGQSRFEEHKKVFEAHRNKFEEYKAGVEARLDALENSNAGATESRGRLSADQEDKHTKDLAAKVDDLKIAVDKCALVKNFTDFTRLADDVVRIDRLLVESADQFAKVDERLERLEKSLSMGARSEVQDRSSFNSVDDTDIGADKAVLDRIAYLEKFVGQSVDKHAQTLKDLREGHSRYEGRVACLERSFGAQRETAENHAKALRQLSAERGKVEQFWDSIETRSKTLERRLAVNEMLFTSKLQESAVDEKNPSVEQDASVFKRVAYIERFLGEAIRELKSGPSQQADGRQEERNVETPASCSTGPKTLEQRLSTIEDHLRIVDFKAGKSKAVEVGTAKRVRSIERGLIDLPFACSLLVPTTTAVEGSTIQRRSAQVPIRVAV